MPDPPNELEELPNKPELDGADDPKENPPVEGADDPKSPPPIGAGAGVVDPKVLPDDKPKAPVPPIEGAGADNEPKENPPLLGVGAGDPKGAGEGAVLVAGVPKLKPPAGAPAGGRLCTWFTPQVTIATIAYALKIETKLNEDTDNEIDYVDN